MQKVLHFLNERLAQKKLWLAQNNWANPTSSSYSNGYDSAVNNEIEFLESLLEEKPMFKDNNDEALNKDTLIAVYDSTEMIGKIDAKILDSVIIENVENNARIIGIVITGSQPIDNFNRWNLTLPFPKSEQQKNLEEFLDMLEYVRSNKI